MFLSIIIPAYNEESRIETTLESVNRFLKKKDYSYEIIVVDDGSTDATVDMVSLLARHIPHLRLIYNEENRGKGYSVRHGMLEATGRYRLFMDADGSTSINELNKLLPYFGEGYDVVISSRQAEGAVVEEKGVLRNVLSALFRFIVTTIVPIGVADSQNGFKLFTARAAEELFPKQHIFRWAFDVELLAIARLHHLKIKEVGIRWVNDERSKVTLKGMVRALVEIAEIRYRLWRGDYQALSEKTVTAKIAA